MLIDWQFENAVKNTMDEEAEEEVVLEEEDHQHQQQIVHTAASPLRWR